MSLMISNRRVTDLCQPLVDGLNRRLGSEAARPRVATVRRALAGVVVDGEAIAEWFPFSSEAYVRVTLYHTPRRQILLLGWLRGQRSRVHDHGGSICGVRVLSGIATETRYELNPAGLAVPVDRATMAAGEVNVSGDADLHRLGNAADAEQPLLTLHVYEPELSMRYYEAQGEMDS